MSTHHVNRKLYLPTAPACNGNYLAVPVIVVLVGPC